MSATTKPVRVQLSRKKGWKMPPNTVSVARPTKFGNPFKVGKHGTRSGCVDLFAKLMDGFLCMSMDNVTEQRACCTFTEFNLSFLRGKNLACWCPLDKPCHADVLLEIANRGDA